MALDTYVAKDANGDNVTLRKLADGRKAAADSTGVALSTEDLAAINALATILGEVQTSPTANTVLDRLKAIATLLGAPLSLPTGAATEAKQDTEIAGLASILTTLQGTIVTGLDRVGGNSVNVGAGAVGTGTQRMTLASDDPAVVALQLLDNAVSGSELQVDVVGALPAGSNEIGTVRIKDISNGEYETVAAGQTTQTLGATGGAGDYLAGVLIVPATTSPGAVQIKDGANSAITVFTGGASSVSNLVPFFVPLGVVSGNGAWQVTTGADVSVVASGNFT